jgi:hypothetical protein
MVQSKVLTWLAKLLAASTRKKLSSSERIWIRGISTTDNGTGTTSVLGAAEAILQSGAVPRRTIRFVLNGRRARLAWFSCLCEAASIENEKSHRRHCSRYRPGPGEEFQLGGRNDLVAAFQPFADSLQNIREIKVSDKTEFGTDTGPFTLAGLPGISSRIRQTTNTPIIRPPMPGKP